MLRRSRTFAIPASFTPNGSKQRSSSSLSKGPPPFSSKQLNTLLKAHRQNPDFDVDDKGRYWRIKPLSRRKMKREQNLNYRHPATRELIDSKSSNINATSASSSSSSTLPVKVIESTETRKRGAFGALAFHHFLHGVSGLDNAERNPLLVRGAMKNEMMMNNSNARRFVVDDDATTLSSSKQQLIWNDITERARKINFVLPFAVTNHVACQVASCPVVVAASSSGSSSSSSSNTNEKHVEQLMNPVAPFSRSARHARVVGKLSRDDKKAQDAQIEKENNRALMAWGRSDATQFENVLVGGDAGVFRCVLIQPMSALQQLVFCGSGDALYVPRGWRIDLSSRASSSGISDIIDEEDAAISPYSLQQRKDGKKEGEQRQQQILPYVLRFMYAPFPDSGTSRLFKNRYVGSDYASSFGDFYDHHGVDKSNSSSSHAEQRRGVVSTRPMNF